VLLTAAVLAARSPQFSTPAPAITALSGNLMGSAICTNGSGGFGGSVQSGQLSITASYTITNTGAIGYVAKLSLNGTFVRNVALTSTVSSISISGCVTGNTTRFTQLGTLSMAIVRSDGVTVSTKSGTTSGCPVVLGFCP
jgi:hypothetical protein